MRLFSLATILVSGSWFIIPAQQSPAPRMEFEAASVRISAPGVNRTDVRVSPSTLIYNGMTLKLLIRTAWHIQDLQIVGGPSWLDSARFDIAAKETGQALPTRLRR